MDLFLPLIRPLDDVALTYFYLFWTAFFIGANILWDILTPRTPKFHVSRLRDKIDVSFNATTFTSSLAVISAVAFKDVYNLLGTSSFKLPLFIAGVAGLFMTIPAICPYSADRGT